MPDGSTVPAQTQLHWARLDDRASADANVGDSLLPGTYDVAATFVPPSGNYSASMVHAKWALTVPIAVGASNASVKVNGANEPSSAMLRILPGRTVEFAASPAPNYSWGTDWDSSAPDIWSGSPELVSDPTVPSFSVRVPAGVAALNISASAFQLGPRITRLTPVDASITVPSGPASGHRYQRSWETEGVWHAFLGRDGVTLKVIGESRESSVSRFEIQAKAPGHDWAPLASGGPAADAQNGPRVPVEQTFSVRLGDLNPLKPLIPLDTSLAGPWLLRARVQNSTGSWSTWSAEQPLQVDLPVKDVAVAGQTLPPVQDADWFTASSTQTYTFHVWIP